MADGLQIHIELSEDSLAALIEMRQMFPGMSDSDIIQHCLRILIEDMEVYTLLDQGEAGSGAPLPDFRDPECPPFKSPGILDEGISPQVPDKEDILAGAFADRTLDRESQAVVFWVLAYGVQAGDLEKFQLTGPDGEVLSEYRGVVERDQAHRFRYVGRQRKFGPWPVGAYTGEYVLTRKTETGATKLLKSVLAADIE